MTLEIDKWKYKLKTYNNYNKNNYLNIASHLVQSEFLIGTNLAESKFDLSINFHYRFFCQCFKLKLLIPFHKKSTDLIFDVQFCSRIYVNYNKIRIEPQINNDFVFVFR